MRSAGAARTGYYEAWDALQALMEKEFPSSRQAPATSSDGTVFSKKSRRLNPLFVAWLMNWPTGWADAENPVGSTNFERWETASYRRALLMLSAYLSTPSPKAKIRRTAKKKETEQLRSVWDEV